MKKDINESDVEASLLESSENLGNVAKKRLMTIFISIGICIAWMIISISAILVNRYIMVVIKFKYPITLSWMGLSMTVVLTNLFSLSLPASERVSFFQRPNIKNSLMTGFFMALSFQLGNTGYMYLTVSFVQMLKALSPVMTIAILAISRLEQFTKPLVISVFSITFGIIVASYGELNRSFIGVAAILMSVVSESIRLVLIQYILVESKLHPMEGLKLVSTACAFWLALQSGVIEMRSIITEGHWRLLVNHPLVTLACCCTGFGVNLTAILVIAYCSSLTLKVVGAFKDIILVLYGVLIFHEHISRVQLIGYGIAIVGFSFYNHLKATTPAPKETSKSS